MIRFVNVLCLFLGLSIIFLFFYKGKITITQEVLDLFPVTEERKIVDVYQKFSHSRFVMVAIKGFSQEASEKLDSFLTEISKLDNVAYVERERKPSNKLQNFINEYYYLIATPNSAESNQDSQDFYTPKLLTQAQITNKLQTGITSLINTQTNSTTSHPAQSSEDSNLPFNPLDPLNFFTLQQDSLKNLIIQDYVYMALVELKSLDSKAITATLEEFERINKQYPEIRFFSSHFMSVKNLSLILSEVNYLLSFSSLIFVVFYFLIIRIPLLTINTICTLIFSNTIAILIVSYVYPKVTIMALSFGMGISNIAIDYMMHHNFFSLYAQKKPVFNKPVFYGYITTLVGFGVCLFIPFPLLSQLALYAIISLSISYVFFAFVYPRIGFSEPRLFMRMSNLRFPSISSYVFLVISLIFFTIGITNLKLDFDLSKLDYQNKEMLQEQAFFDRALRQDNLDILLSSSSVDGLITLSKILQKTLDLHHSKFHKQDSMRDFIPLSILPTQRQITQNVAFLQSKEMQQNKAILQQIIPQMQKTLQKRNNTNDINVLLNLIATSYEVKEIPTLDKNFLTDLGFNIVADTKDDIATRANETQSSQDSTTYHYLVSIPKTYLPFIQEIRKNIQESEFTSTDSLTLQEKELLTTQHANIETRSLQSIINSITEKIYEPMLIILAVAFCLMTLTLLWTAKGAFLDSYIFILFPLSSALFVVSTHGTLNLMHLFALLILVVVSVDYGIYSVKEGNNPRTAHAIFFSSITTGLSFGILIVSQTKALNSFGEIVFVGMSCVLLLLVFHKPIHKQLSF
ncbi:hypothetical protein CQA66_00580 [Helicobacter aurati]|uniref:Membrane transport protein MMPL domain-containing protein n=1 Tax=Helicobacter aurati TaxID=137778 RepID=A0A3D8JA17_9HELI|nr:hypothetical protein [Helicobacter aurati]RDU73714.1 hypothetical protein CQA66_00580 [Helicobacter aurati]